MLGALSRGSSLLEVYGFAPNAAIHVNQLIDAVMSINEHVKGWESEKVKQTLLKREDLKLVYFEYMW
jgi:hypothetical protein